MPCDCVRTRTSLSSTTTSDPRRSTKPLDQAWIRGFALLREARSGPDSAGIPQEIRSRCRLMPIMQHARTPELPGPRRSRSPYPSRLSPSPGAPEAHMASRLFEIVAGRVRLAGAS
jgi:hypothetical protein